MARQRFDRNELIPWIDVRFDPAAGPGGQHVNKASTRATVLFDLNACELLSPWQKRRIRTRLSGRLARDGRIRVVSQRERSQTRNREAAEERLVELLNDALVVQKPRKPTAPTRGSSERRLRAKREHGAKKRLRQRPPRGEE